MPVNPYFSSGKGIGNQSEGRLIKNLAAELIKIHGYDMVYCPRKAVKEDLLLGEDVLAAFTSYFYIEMMMEDAEGYTSEQDFLNKFGLVIPDTFKLLVSSDRFFETTKMGLPAEGDLIYFPTGGALFEIKFFQDEKPFYPINILPWWTLTCELFSFSYENFDTGHPEVDELAEIMNAGDSFGKNETAETEGDRYVDWSEKDPFGEAGGLNQ